MRIYATALATALLVLGLPASTSAWAKPVPEETAIKEQAKRRYADLPVAFVPNIGQYEKEVKFSATGQSYSFFLTQAGATYGFSRENNGAHAVKILFAGAAPDAPLKGSGRKSGKINYISGKSTEAKTAPLFGKVTYGNLYPGIDLTFHGTAKKNGALGGRKLLKYEFRVDPGSDHRKIKLVYSGVSGLKVSGSGDLIVKTPLGDLIDKKPFVYQKTADGKTRIDARFTVSGKTVEFEVGEYDRGKALFIDPTLDYSTFLGSDSYDYGLDIALDASNNAYITGCSGATGYPTTAGAFQTIHAGGWDVIVSKLNSSGSALVYSTFIGGAKLDRGTSIAVDEDGNAYVAGFTQSTDFPVTSGAFDQAPAVVTSAGSRFRMQTPQLTTQDGFITKLDSSGSGLVYSTFLGGSAMEWINDLALDQDGNAYVAGETESSDFPTTSGVFDRQYNNYGDGFVAKLNGAGSGLYYSTFLGGSFLDGASAIAVDFSGYAYVGGGTRSNDFPVTNSVYNNVSDGQMDGFITRLNRNGSALKYSGLLGGGDDDEVTDLALDFHRNVYVTGKTASNNFPVTPGALDTTYDGEVDGFVAKLENSFKELGYSTFLGGDEVDLPAGIAVNGRGEAHVAGATDSESFSGVAVAEEYVRKIFVARLNTAGSALRFFDRFGGSDGDWGTAIALDNNNRAYVTGATGSSDFPTTPGAFDRVYNGGPADVFVAKLSVGARAQDEEADIDPPKTSTAISKTRIFPVSWFAYNPTPTQGIANFTVRYRPASDSGWTDWKTGTQAVAGNFVGSPGRTYYFRVKATGTAGGTWWSDNQRTVVPYNEDALIFRREGFAGKINDESSNYYMDTVRFSRTAGNEIVFKFQGKDLRLISTKGPNRSRAKIYIDGRYRKTVDAYSEKYKYRRPLYSTSWDTQGEHFLKVVNLGTPGRDRFDIDALAVGR